MYRFAVRDFVSDLRNAKMVYVGDLSTHSPICDVRYNGKTIGEWVEEMDASLCNNCNDPDCYVNNKCYLFDRIIMRQFDYFENRDDRSAAVIVFNTGYGVIGLMKCVYDSDGTTRCELQV